MIKEYFSPDINNIRDKLVRIKEMGNISELHVSNISPCTEFPIKKISNTEYLVKSTGEIKEYNYNKKSRIDNKDSVRRSLHRLRDIINSNITDVNTVRWITLTYAENMTDTKSLYTDYMLFWKRLKYHFREYKNLQYIIACEPQGRGAWHIHLLLLFNQNAPYIDNNILTSLWGKGFTKVTALKDKISGKAVTNVGAYLCAYLGDMELTNNCNYTDSIVTEKSCVGKNGEIIKKKIIKGGRLSLYPLKFNLYRCSKGVKRPLERKDYADNYINGNNGKMTYSNGIRLVDVGGVLEYSYFYFNKLSNNDIYRDNNYWQPFSSIPTNIDLSKWGQSTITDFIL